MGDVVWTMFVLLFWCMAIWIFIVVFADILRRADIGGGAKALWILLIVVLPIFGALIYIISRPRITDYATGDASTYASSNPVPGGRDSLHMG
jgi:predicted membrane channel-forming protein YqfA (hemolysin III family)